MCIRDSYVTLQYHIIIELTNTHTLTLNFEERDAVCTDDERQADKISVSNKSLRIIIGHSDVGFLIYKLKLLRKINTERVAPSG